MCVATHRKGTVISATRSVLLRSSWANVNIGDVAHSPGLVTALRSLAPDADVVLWPLRLGEREEAMLREADPRLTIVRGELDDDGDPTTDELRAAWDRADVLVHGSAAGAFLDRELTAWRERTGKPYGYAGITVDALCPPGWGTLENLRAAAWTLPSSYQAEASRAALDGAEFVYTRDTTTLGYLRGQDISPGLLEFGPDGTFAYGYGDDRSAERLLADLQLDSGAFGCFVPRQRYVPYPDIYGIEMTREWHRKYAINAATTGPDLDVLAAAIAAWVRGTGQPALVVPEMSYAVELAQRELMPRVPEDVSDKVLVLDRYWPLEEAYAVYAHARAVVSMECHSPILATSHGAPTIYLRQPTETVKGQMYSDLGASGTVIEVERDGAAGVAAAIGRLLSEESSWRATSTAMNRAARSRLEDVAGTVLYGDAAPTLTSAGQRPASAAAHRLSSTT